MGYRLNRLDEPVFVAVSKHLLTEFGINHRLESCGHFTAISCECSTYVHQAFFLDIGKKTQGEKNLISSKKTLKLNNF